MKAAKSPLLKMIAESQTFRRQVLWFTTLVSHGENLPPLYRALTEAGAVKVVKRDGPGQKQSRFIADLYGWRPASPFYHP